MIKLATVSPCFNEEEGLALSVAKLTDLFQALIAEGKIAPDSMIVLVNDTVTIRSFGASTYPITSVIRMPSWPE